MYLAAVLSRLLGARGAQGLLRLLGSISLPGRVSRFGSATLQLGVFSGLATTGLSHAYCDYLSTHGMMLSAYIL